MAEYDNSNRGALFHADKKGNEKAPDYRGTLNVDGAEYELAGWKRVSKKGKSFLSLTIQVPRERRADGGGGGDGSAAMKDEDIPFILSVDVSPERRFRL